MEKHLDNFKEFNHTYQEYLNLKSEENVNGLNRNLAIISTILDTKCFDPLINPDVSLFYINLHNLIETIDAQSTLLWTSIAALQQALNSSFHKTLVEDLKFLSVLTKLLEEVTGKVKILKLLNILQKLTLNVKLTWNEPYLVRMMKALVQFIQGEEDEIVHFATLVLINLCFNNVPAIECFREQFDYESVLESVQKHTILKFKLQYILFEPSEELKFELSPNRFMKHVFSEVRNSLTTWNVDVLTHTVDFFVDLKQYYRKYFQELDECADEISNLLIKLDERLKKDEKIGDGKALTNDQSKFLQKIMEFIKYLIEFVANENRSVCLRVLDFALKWTEDDIIAKDSYEIIQEMLQLPDCCHDEEMNALLIKKLPEVLLMTDKMDFHVEAISSLFKFLLGLLSKEKFKEFVLNSLYQGFFQQFLDKISNYKGTEMHSMPKTELSMNIYGLKLFQILSLSRPHEWKSTFETTLKNENTQNILGQALFLKDPTLIEFALQILRGSNCSLETIASTISEIFTDSNHCLNTSTVKNYHNRVFVTQKVNRYMQERIEKCIDKILGARSSNEFNSNLNLNEVIDLFEFKISMTNNNELFLLKRLDDAGSELTTLSHQNVLLKSQKMHLKEQIGELKLVKKREMQAGLKAMVEAQKIGDELNQLKTLMKENDLENKSLLNIISTKDVEISNLTIECQKTIETLSDKNKELEEMKTKLEEKENHIKNLGDLTCDTRTTIEKLKFKINTKNQEIEDAELEIKSYVEENSCLKKIIDELNSALNEKNSVITEYETEVKEIETMKTRLIEIVQKKKDRELLEANSNKSNDDGKKLEVNLAGDSSEWD